MNADPDWKPTACTDCGAPHPSWSLTGPTGPWRCFSCHTVSPYAPRVTAPPPPPRPAPREGLLL
jgi:hypothetical protein